ncbi:hypothetical protein CAAU_0291 [Caloramator australicus RC3]|uniref:Uncharacterized protein n=1 Tax=Caloramator australicus RC3 TaxID=857293 RepID=G0V4A0_9CLOT|nr:hypothetical protein CAAU_0291 [Caloramator australicus RC3]
MSRHRGINGRGPLVGGHPFMPRKALTSGGIVSYCLLGAV